jgi:catechol 2,3-dioxygenase-like lactoylglutathione lyase family enzyme
MSNNNLSILSHVSLGTNDLQRSSAFYDRALAPLGIRRVVTIAGDAIAYGKQHPEFWIAIPHNDQLATVGNGVHVGFIANSKEEVHAFHQAALVAGGVDDGAPGPRPMSGDAYYGCFIVDLDGHKIEASFWDAFAG